jgi:hypothetical protein
MTPDQIGLVIARRFIHGGWQLDIENLAAHISSAINQAMADERERCAKIADAFPLIPGDTTKDAVAAAIRGNKP